VIFCRQGYLGVLRQGFTGLFTGVTSRLWSNAVTLPDEKARRYYLHDAFPLRLDV
jgi:hypothetical protein